MSLFFRFIHFHLRISIYLVTWKKICTFRFSMYVDNIKLDNIMQQNLHIRDKLRVFDLNYVCVESYTREKSQLVTYKSI